jgi:hypothetical protein
MVQRVVLQPDPPSPRCLVGQEAVRQSLIPTPLPIGHQRQFKYQAQQPIKPVTKLLAHQLLVQRVVLQPDPPSPRRLIGQEVVRSVIGRGVLVPVTGLLNLLRVDPLVFQRVHRALEHRRMVGHSV